MALSGEPSIIILKDRDEAMELFNVGRWSLPAVVAAVLLAGCTTVTLKGDENEPIVVNLNVKIDQEVRVRLDKEIEDLIADNPDIF